jgi:malonate decarboxylase beta subunit
MKLEIGKSYYEASARQRINYILDKGTFKEILPPHEKKISPHLEMFNIPVAFDDGVAIGEGKIDGKPVSILAQEGKLMGGAFGEVHSSKIIGILRRSLKTKPDAVICLWDSGGVRLQEANAGEIGVTEIIRAIFDLRAEKIPVIGVVGGSCGCFGGAGIISACCDVLIASEEGRIGVSGPEVIETTMGVDAFDSRDKALVWRTTGAKNRYIFGFVKTLVENNPDAFRAEIIQRMNETFGIDLEKIEEKQKLLQKRVDDFSELGDALEIWDKMGFEKPEDIPAMSAKELAENLKKISGGAK